MIAGLDPFKFNLKSGHFDNQSNLHGISHTYRVMCHVLLLGSHLGYERETRLAFCGAFIHDMSRQHDGYCREHGLWAARNKLPFFTEFFRMQGVNTYELNEISVAVENHSAAHELPTSDSSYKTAALLKDADALDRIRLGPNDLKPEYLRFDVTHVFIRFAEDLYYRTCGLSLQNFREVMDIAIQLPSRPA